eukprot:5535296-Ditylum_brightwellii.AAC.1
MPEGPGALPFCICMMALRTSSTLGGSPRLRNSGWVRMIGKVESSQGGRVILVVHDGPCYFHDPPVLCKFNASIKVFLASQKRHLLRSVRQWWALWWAESRA